jgi:hypothetical protein
VLSRELLIGTGLPCVVLVGSGRGGLDARLGCAHCASEPVNKQCAGAGPYHPTLPVSSERPLPSHPDGLIDMYRFSGTLGRIICTGFLER